MPKVRKLSWKCIRYFYACSDRISDISKANLKRHNIAILCNNSCQSIFFYKHIRILNIIDVYTFCTCTKISLTIDRTYRCIIAYIWECIRQRWCLTLCNHVTIAIVCECYQICTSHSHTGKRYLLSWRDNVGRCREICTH